MKAIILAAGEGKRLKPFTDRNPKCLLPLEGKSILDRQIETMHSLGLSDVVCVKGYMADKIMRDDIKFYINEKFSTTNMVMTLWCAKEEFNDDIIISYGDILYNAEVLEKVMKSPHDISVVVDREWEAYWKMRFDEPLKDAEALKMDNQSRIKVIGQKAKNISDVEAGYIGLIKFSKKGLETLRTSFLNAQRAAEKGDSPWGISRPFEGAYMTDMLQGLINEGNEVYGTLINGGWFEIDSNRDYDLAKRLFVNGKVTNLHAVCGRK